MYKYIKRFLDIFLSVSALIVFAVPMVIFSVIIKCESKGPIIFKQKRIGKNKKEFYIYKVILQNLELFLEEQVLMNFRSFLISLREI